MTFFLHEKTLSLTENNQSAGTATAQSRGTLPASLFGSSILIKISRRHFFSNQNSFDMKNYQCKKCKTTIQNNSSPSSFNCPGGGMHSWTDLGEVGANNYQCKKCGTLVKSKNSPSSFNCPSGSMHSWTKL